MQEEREDNKSFDDGFNSTDDNVTTGIEIDEYSFLETPKIVKEALHAIEIDNTFFILQMILSDYLAYLLMKANCGRSQTAGPYMYLSSLFIVTDS